MQREQFTALPLSLALGAIYDAIPSLASAQAPQLPRAQKYDTRLTRKGGTYCWLSEMSLESLVYWEKLKRTSAESGGEFAEKDRKLATTLAYWVTWRQVFPNDRWHGKRGEESVTADPPSRDPALYEWGPRGGGSRHQTEREDSPPPAAADEYGDLDTDDSIPF
jgi:hypothetical protein